MYEYLKNNIGTNTDPCGTPLKRVSSLISPLLLFLSVSCLYTMLVSNGSYFPLCHWLFI